MVSSTSSVLQFESIYRELRMAAAALLDRERANHTLSPTALVHEAWLRVGKDRDPMLDEVLFRRLAVRVMRRLLIDHARHRNADKRDARLRIALDPDAVVSPEDEVDLIDLDDALNSLGASDPRAVRAIELRVFGGLKLRELAETFDVSTSQAKRILDEAILRLRGLLGSQEEG